MREIAIFLLCLMIYIALPLCGQGVLVTDFVDREPLVPVEIVLDCSASMLKHLGGQRKIDIAREVIWQLISELPQETPLGLRAYGHRYRPIGKGEEYTCTDSELLVPILPDNRDRISKAMAILECKGKTPLAYSIKQVSSDIREFSHCKVIIISDGQESCHRDPIAAAKNMLQVNAGLDFHLIGFDLQTKAETIQLRRLAHAAKGIYHAAPSTEDLLLEIRAALSILYIIADDSGKLVSLGVIGERENLANGNYEIIVYRNGKRYNARFVIREKQVSRVLFSERKRKILVVN